MARWREQHIFRASKPSNPIALSSQPRRPGKMAWPRQPLPPDYSYTAVVRIRGGLDCSKYHPIYLKSMMQEAAQLAADIDSARVNTLNNTLLITSTSMDRIDAYLRVKSLTIAGKTHEVVVHPTSPQDSCKGIFALPVDIKEAEILPHLRQANQEPAVLHARRMGQTETILVTFLGKKVPFYVQYAHCWLRCTPFRQKVEACVKCKQIGHRPDVCPVVCVPTCEKCGEVSPDANHTCNHKCVVCAGDHATGSAQCPQRYKPKKTPPPPKKKKSDTKKSRKEPPPPLKGTEHWPALPTPSTSQSGPVHSQVSWAGVASRGSSLPNFPPNLTNTNQFFSLAQENAMLRAKIAQIEAQIQLLNSPISSMSNASEDMEVSNNTQASPVVAPPPRNTAGPPPAKRRSSDEAEILLDADAYMDLNDRITDLETKTGQRFLALETRITHLETRMTNIESKIDELKNMIATIIPLIPTLNNGQNK
ncbi:hypothetical protein HPB49_011318 [Dermacentor silvarum]|uniref:Uncharacterized protein n=1 Tax=Dermacentor silvarum TaxID=543639 RepID=A0ACB8D4L3_DERSI|nr:hypothetical protein HPB49_011318 [Dermacentor silvarum]